MNTFMLITSLIVIMLIGMMITISETKEWKKTRNILLIILFCIGLLIAGLNPESMTGVAYQLPCAIIGMLVGISLPINKK